MFDRLPRSGTLVPAGVGLARGGLLALAVVMISSGSYADEVPSDAPDTSVVGVVGKALLDSGRALAEGDATRAAATATDAAAGYLLDNIGEDAPEWARRIELEIDAGQGESPEWSILTVQPLWESDDLKDTLFTQLSYRRYEMFGEDRDVLNAGVGYRRLLLDNTVLVGVNSFMDYEFQYNHQRGSVGAEAKWAGLDFNANYYLKVSDPHSRNGVTEEVLDGGDVELTAQVPYLPWARIRGRRYWWSTANLSEDIEGWQASTEVDLTQNLRVEGGIDSNNYNSGDEQNGFLRVSFHLALGDKDSLTTTPVSDTAWTMRDMVAYRLDKVRRENKIIVERRASGVVITRGS